VNEIRKWVYFERICIGNGEARRCINVRNFWMDWDFQLSLVKLKFKNLRVSSDGCDKN